MSQAEALRSEEGGWGVSESACHAAGEAREAKPCSPCSVNRYLLDTCCARGTVQAWREWLKQNRRKCLCSWSPAGRDRHKPNKHSEWRVPWSAEQGEELGWEGWARHCQRGPQPAEAEGPRQCSSGPPNDGFMVTKETRCGFDFSARGCSRRWCSSCRSTNL